MSEAGIPNTASTAPRNARSFFERLLGVLRLDAASYDDIAADPRAVGQAAGVVAIAAIGRSISAQGGPLSFQALWFLGQLILLWPMLTLLVYGIGRWFGHTPDVLRVARVMGFAMAPFALGIFHIVPVDWARNAIDLLWVALLIATLVVGIRQSLQTTTGQAAFIAVVIALILFFVSMVYQYLTT
jgi:hypothetical protein